MTYEIEMHLLGAWLNGEHTKDLQIFIPADFDQGGNAECVKMLRNGKTILDIIREDPEYRYDIESITAYYIPAAYESAFAEAAEEIRWRLLQSGASLGYVMKRMRLLDDRLRGVDSDPVIQRDLLTIWDTEKEEQRSNGQCGYGIGKLDYLTGGIFKGHLTALAGRPASGKSALALQIASHVAMHERKRVIFFSLEMGITEQLDRLLMQTVGVMDASRLKHGDLTPEEIQAFRRKIQEVEREKLLLFSTDRSIEKIEEAIKNEKPFMIIIDQLTQLTFSGRVFPNDLERYKHLTRHLKMLTNTTGVTILLLCQLNRTAAGKEPTLQQLKDSGSIEEDSDNVLLIYSPPGTDDVEVKSPRSSFKHLKIAKQRSGTAAIIDDLVFDPASMTIFEYKPTI